MARLQKMRVRKHKVVLNRSRGGDTGIFVILAIMGAIMFLPMLYTIMQSLKPLDELWYFPPKFYVINPTIKNFTDLFRLMGQSWVPFSRYLYNTVVISVGGTFGHLLIASMAAYVLAKMKFPGRQKIVVSKKWGFTKYTREEYAEMRQNGKLVATGNIAKYIPDHGKLEA